MEEAALNAITDANALRALVREKMAKGAQPDIIARCDHQITCKTANIDQLTHELARLRRLRFPAKSERMNPGQRELFDQAMAAGILRSRWQTRGGHHELPCHSRSPRHRPLRLAQRCAHSLAHDPESRHQELHADEQVLPLTPCSRPRNVWRADAHAHGQFRLPLKLRRLPRRTPSVAQVLHSRIEFAEQHTRGRNA